MKSRWAFRLMVGLAIWSGLCAFALGIRIGVNYVVYAMTH
jgi:hypothetical protein